MANIEMMNLELSEHTKTILYPRSVSTLTKEEHSEEYLRFSLVEPRIFKKKKGKSLSCFQLHANAGIVSLEANYYIGLDWLITEESYVHVRPKVNTTVFHSFVKQLEVEDLPPKQTRDEEVESEIRTAEVRELNYLKMFLDAMANPIVSREIDGLILIDWEAPKIQIEQRNDMLTPFLVVQFLKLLKEIARKGLKKSYYKVRQQLNNRIRGKILVGEHTKRNVMKHRLTSNYCEYQEFGIDNDENRFLKKVLRFVGHYVAGNREVFKGVEGTVVQMINFCTPVFENVTQMTENSILKQVKNNPFFEEYKEAIKIGDYIMKRFSYNISTAVSEKTPTPPFWIDMPMLFELYTYSLLLEAFEPREVEYHHNTYGNELDFLVKKDGAKMVVDAKYKMHYKASHIHSDIRQVSGYARLRTVYNALEIVNCGQLIDCLIIYPCAESQTKDYDIQDAIIKKYPIKAYQGIFKLGIPIPWL